MATSATFRFSYGVFRPLLSLLGMGPMFSRVELESGTLRVRMGWAFGASIPVHQITAVEPRSGLVGGIGVHGFRGRWLVNGATTGLVAITVDPPVRAAVIGFPVSLRVLTLSLEDPDALVAALAR
ncbi:MAG TPA: hypothetical protein VK215_07680 [Acidimicrobiales bacterium]|nr:hypothetical protein [Acidimicrobiales bacterium]